jgi:methyl-galactoside transport system permease protein
MANEVTASEETAKREIVPLSSVPEIASGLKKADELRASGVTKIAELEEEIVELKKNKEIDDDTRKKLIAEDKAAIVEAKKVRKANAPELRQVVNNTAKVIEKEGWANVNASKKVYKEERQKLKKEYEEEMAKLIDAHKARLSSIEASGKSEEQRKQAIKDENFSFKSEKSDANRLYTEKKQKIKDEDNDVYLDKFNSLNSLRGNHNAPWETAEYRARQYIYKFSLVNFLMKYALYIIILILYIYCVIYAPIGGFGDLLTWENILKIFAQSSTRIFFALGVAGLILLAGTDLSIGRLAGVGMTFTAVLLHRGDNVIVFFPTEKNPNGWGVWNFDGWPEGSRIIVALLLSVVFCTLFSAIAGFFTAKFKMHPFITTLSTQLIAYGFMMYATIGTNSGSLDPTIKADVAGNWGDFSKLILYAIAAIIIVWFVWNKTKFGKNMYAVGGNAEAASVSGISVFWVTFGVFIMAGILYGLGAFLEGARLGLGSANSGYGYELDAIAACVVGGISFNGGIGKISGAVIGVIIFTGLNYCLNFIKFDTNIQFIIKGVIIMVAVALDSLKYLKKK